MLHVHPDLRRYVLTVVIMGSVCGIVGIVCILVAGSRLVEILGERGKGTTLGEWLLVAFGTLMVALAYLCVVVVPRWYRLATRVFENVIPVDMEIILRKEEWSETEDWYVELFAAGSTAKALPFRRDIILPPRWNAKSFVDHPLAAKVYLDPKSKLPLVIRTQKGLLWIMAKSPRI